MMKRIVVATLPLIAITLSSCASVLVNSANYSLLEDNAPHTGYVRVRVTMIDHEMFFSGDPKNVLPGNHSVGLSICEGGGGNCSSSNVQCNTLAGYRYTVAPYGCTYIGRRMDFEGAASYWATIDADSSRKAAEEAALDRQLKNEANEAEQYAQQRKARYLQAERNRQEALAQIVTFRKSLGEGSETNCGPVIEAKEKLVKVAYAVEDFGNEHWIRRDQIFPRGYGCRFERGEYQPPRL